MFSWTDYNSGDFLWLGDWGSQTVILLAILGIAILGLSLIDLAPMPSYRKWTLLGLRGSIFVLAILLLLEPALDLKNVSRVKNHVAILVDNSESMQLAANASGTSRQKQVQAILDELPTGANDNHQFHIFTVGSSLEPASIEALKASNFGATASDITQALVDLPQKLGRVELGGVVLITDGTDTGGIGSRTRHGEALDESSIQLLKKLQAPVNTVAVGAPEDIQDIAITRVKHDDFAFVHNRVSIQVHLQSVGFDTTVPVHLYRDHELLQTRMAVLGPDTPSPMIEFEFVPKQIGREVYRVAIPVEPKEILESNNEAIFVQKVIRDKIRVLQVVGRPSWDERFLRQLLKRNPNVDLISFFILRTAENVQMGSNDELSLIPFPTDELFSREIGSFDLVIFQNFDFGPYSMRQYLDDIANFVKQGGGFVMVGGDLSFASGGYASTPIEEILPVMLPPGNARTLIDTERFRPVLTNAGARHPITQLAFDPAVNADLWQSLPQQRGTNLVLQARDGATVLATHPRLKARGQPMPVITVGEAEKGRVMAMTTDSSWRWGFENAASAGTSREYQMFWNNALRWLIKDPALKLLRIEFERDSWTPGSRPNIVVRLQNPDYTPAQQQSGTLTIQVTNLRSQEVDGQPQTLEFQTDDRGIANLSIDADREGIWKLKAEAKSSAGQLVDEDLFLVVASQDEFRDILPRPDLLASMAELTQGNHFQLPSFSAAALRFKEPTAVQVNRRRVVNLWDSSILFLVILSLLAAEWTLRRRWGRL